MNLKDMVARGKKVRISSYCSGQLWYKTEDGFEFPVPVNDRKEVGNARFLPEDKAIYFMRYIRRHIQYLKDAKHEAQRNRTS